MNEQIKAIIDRARALLASATATPWRNGTGASVVAGVPVPEMPGSDELRFYGGHLIGESIVERNADAIVFAVNNIGTLCNALEAAERRAEESEAQLRNQADAMTCGLRNELRMLGERNAAIVECDTFKRRAEEAEARVADLENVRIEQAAELRRHLAEIAELRDRAGIAEGREAAAKANAEQMAGWLDARNAGLVQMARERDALRIEAEALRVERDVADRECDRLRTQVDADRQELTRIAEKVARLEARRVSMCLCVDYRIHCKGGDPQYCQSGHDHETVGPREGCKKCGGAGAVIVEGAAQEGGAE